jgi:hypothetical protein
MKETSRGQEYLEPNCARSHGIMPAVTPTEKKEIRVLTG